MWQVFGRSTTGSPTLNFSYKATEDTVLQEIDRDLVAESTKGVLLQDRHSYRTLSQKYHNFRKPKHRSIPCSLIPPKWVDPQTDLSNTADEVS